ncbi:hypothetical protein C8R43DRAFT_886375 [Mycena crocata]|nr:hypothetical protein C8R43DRAFT_886375 [Mycena crocata]
MPPGRQPPTDAEPWAPFPTRLDFEVAEFVVDVMLNKNQTKTLLSLIRRCAANIDAFTIQSHSDLEKHWERASKKCTAFQPSEVLVPYKRINQAFEMHARPLWDWTLDLLQDPHLTDFFVWDAEQDFRFNGQKWIRFFTEPWTAKAFWDIQSQLPKGPETKSCPYIIYADKAKLSSFGTQKGYPIVARLANVVVGLRNSTNWGGGQIVGWLPVVPENEDEKCKQAYTNFKMAVWHQAFYKLLESIVLASRTGVWVKCGDGIDRRLFPCILILAADYEETCVMTLIRGLKSKYPCPMCYVKNQDQADLFPTELPALRTGERSQTVVKQAQAQRTAEKRESILKAHGLRNVENVFWKIAHSDPHFAASFEHLHTYASGLWGHHLFSQIKKHAELAPGRAAGKIDRQFAAFPRWRNLNHFKAVMGVTFNDGTKHTDIAKVIILVSVCILHGAVLNISQKYIEACEDDDDLVKLLKGWNFIKIHLQTHLSDDIERKGAAINFGTKIDESMHGPARSAYLRQTNFKNVAPQILKSDHRRLVAKYVREQLNDLDKCWEREWEEGEEDEEQEDLNALPDDLHLLGNVCIGSKQPAISFRQLEASDNIFSHFRLDLTRFLNQFLVNYGHPLPDGKRVKLLSESEITPFRFLKVFYQSMDDWTDETDYLRCNPSFHGSARFDGALVKTATGHIFVKLRYMFQITLGEGETYPFALVEPLDAPLGRPSAKDQALKLFRVRAGRALEFISVHSIVRGAVLAPDFDRDGDYFVMDTEGADMFLRMRDMYADRRA